MRSYRNYSTVVIEEKAAAKEKNKEILSRLKEYFSPLAAKFNKKFLQGDARKAQSAERKSNNTIDAVRQAPNAMRLPPGRRRQKERGQNHGG